VAVVVVTVAMEVMVMVVLAVLAVLGAEIRMFDDDVGDNVADATPLRTTRPSPPRPTPHYDANTATPTPIPPASPPVVLTVLAVLAAEMRMLDDDVGANVADAGPSNTTANPTRPTPPRRQHRDADTNTTSVTTTHFLRTFSSLTILRECVVLSVILMPLSRAWSRR
jgi:hypothetical protein